MAAHGVAVIAIASAAGGGSAAALIAVGLVAIGLPALLLASLLATLTLALALLALTLLPLLPLLTTLALLASLLPGIDRVHKVTIVPRGRALGYTWQRPTEDRFLLSELELQSRLMVLLGGRVAEGIVFSEISTGGADDLARATDVARRMVTEYGMSDNLGPQQLGQPGGEVFLGRDLGHQANYSEEVAATIDREIRGLIDDARTARIPVRLSVARDAPRAIALYERLGFTASGGDDLRITMDLPPRASP